MNAHPWVTLGLVFSIGCATGSDATTETDDAGRAPTRDSAVETPVEGPDANPVTSDSALDDSGNGMLDSGSVVDSGSSPCMSNNDCSGNEICKKADGDCNGMGVCTVRPNNCGKTNSAVCGCDHATYFNACLANASGVDIDYAGACE